MTKKNTKQKNTSLPHPYHSWLISPCENGYPVLFKNSKIWPLEGKGMLEEGRCGGKGRAARGPYFKHLNEADYPFFFEQTQLGGGVELDKDSERKKCEIFNGRGGDARFCRRHIKLQFSPYFVRGLFCLVMPLLFFSIQRLFNSWHNWARWAPFMPFRICPKGSRPWMPDNKTPPSTWR